VQLFKFSIDSIEYTQLDAYFALKLCSLLSSVIKRNSCSTVAPLCCCCLLPLVDKCKSDAIKRVCFHIFCCCLFPCLVLARIDSARDDDILTVRGDNSFLCFCCLLHSSNIYNCYICLCACACLKSAN